MDPITFSNFHQALTAQGFSGNELELSNLLRQADESTKEQNFLSFMQRASTDSQIAQVRRVIRHARKHKMHIAHAVIGDRMLVLSGPREPAVRIGTVVFAGGELRLNLYRGNDRVGDRHFEWK